MTPAARAVEVLKLLRQQPRSFEEIRRELCWSRPTVRQWLAELLAGGLIVKVQGTKPDDRSGPAPMVYEIAPAWRNDARIAAPQCGRRESLAPVRQPTNQQLRG